LGSIRCAKDSAAAWRTGLAGARVICTNIPEFATLRDDAVHVYKDAAEFMATIDWCVQVPAPNPHYNGYPYRELLRTAIQRGFREVAGIRSAPQVRPCGSVPSITRAARSRVKILICCRQSSRNNAAR
jgi:hypothetical protein